MTRQKRHATTSHRHLDPSALAQVCGGTEPCPTQTTKPKTTTTTDSSAMDKPKEWDECIDGGRATLPPVYVS